MEGDKFSTWKDFAIAVVEELDDLKSNYENLKKQRDDDHDKFVEFRTATYTIAAIVVLIFGIIEISIKL